MSNRKSSKKVLKHVGVAGGRYKPDPAGSYYVSFRRQDAEWRCLAQIYITKCAIVEAAFNGLLRLCEQHSPGFFDFELLPVTEIFPAESRELAQRWNDSEKRLQTLEGPRSTRPADFRPTVDDMILMTLSEAFEILLARAEHDYRHPEEDESTELGFSDTIVEGLRKFPRWPAEVEAAEPIKAEDCSPKPTDESGPNKTRMAAGEVSTQTTADTATVNARMFDTLCKNPDSRDWTARRWATHLGLKSHTPVLDQPTWKTLQAEREAAKINRTE